MDQAEQVGQMLNKLREPREINGLRKLGGLDHLSSLIKSSGSNETSELDG